MTAYASLARYLTAATLARGADAGVAVGLVLLAVANHSAATGGALVAALTAPHVLGPVVARRLDAARDGRRPLAAAFVVYGAALAAAALALGRAPLPVALAAAALAGACGAMLTGGLSSRLAGIAPRAEGWDATSYGIAGTAGPAAVAALAAVIAPQTAVLALALAAAAAGAMVLTLPATPPPAREPMTVRAALRTVASTGPLRRVAVITTVTSFSFGAVASVLAVVYGAELSASASAGAVLATVFGLGNLAGSMLVTAVPLRREPEIAMAAFATLMAATLALTAPAPTYPLALAGFALTGALNGPFVAATLAGRSPYSPPEARAQIFVSLAGVKIAAAAAGTALAGAATSAGPRALLVAAAAITLGGAAASTADRRAPVHPARVRAGRSSHRPCAPLEET
jgi:hypothetical protein